MGLMLRAIPARVALARTALARDDAVADAWRALWISRLLVWAAGVAAVLAFGLSGREGDFDPAGLTAPFGGMG
ncbi:MAG: hypothetical protein H0W36_13005, partial [Gemmatimonadetes bacterium]|nr:hypothetical protein [Gemmatimonadota bacterium]